LKRVLLKSLVSLMLVTMLVSVVSAAPPTLIWSSAVFTEDIKLSKDGNYVAIASGNQMRFYGKSSGTPLWTNTLSTGSFHSVAISSDGDCVVAGGDLHVYFWKNARSLTGNPSPTWTGVDLTWNINRRCIDISDDGNYVVAGTHNLVYYWANAKEKSGPNIATTWTYSYPAPTVVWALDLSSDGNYVAASYDDRVVYWKNARTLTGTQSPAWTSTEPDSTVVDVAISVDGNYVVVASEHDLSVHYWANAKILTGDPASTWWGGVDVSFSSIDLSSDGDSVIAGASSPGRRLLLGRSKRAERQTSESKLDLHHYNWDSRRGNQQCRGIHGSSTKRRGTTQGILVRQSRRSKVEFRS